jgi:hypothetical protein
MAPFVNIVPTPTHRNCCLSDAEFYGECPVLVRNFKVAHDPTIAPTCPGHAVIIEVFANGGDNRVGRFRQSKLLGNQLHSMTRIERANANPVW